MATSNIDSRIEVRSSGIHGRGVYARKRIKKGKAIIEYTGERIDEDEANERYHDNPSTYLFMVDDDVFIDGLAKGNEARFINHSCKPNCEALLEDDGRIIIYARKNIDSDTELTYDYQLTDEGPDDDAVSTDYTCRCGAKKCTGTMKASAKKKKKKKKR